MKRGLSIKKVIENKSFTLVIVLVAIVIVFQIINKNYLSVDNLRNILTSASLVGMLSVGIACLLISGQIDLSTGYVGTFGGILIAVLIRGGMPWVPALLVTVGVGAVIGLINALFVNVLGFMSFISTLALGMAINGYGQVLCNGQNQTVSDMAFWELGSATLFNIFPVSFLIMIALFLIYGVILFATRFGRRTYMVGGNANAARLAGINPKGITTLLYVNNGCIACLAGAIITARMHMSVPNGLINTDFEAITAAVLGGVSFLGGGGNMVGVFIGLILLSGFKNGLMVVGLQSHHQIMATGLLLIAALALDFFREKSRQKALKASEA